MPNLVSVCCNRSVDDGIYRDFPLGGTTWGNNYKTKVCSCCGIECEEVESCEVCGVVGCSGGCEDEITSELLGSCEGSTISG